MEESLKYSKILKFIEGTNKRHHTQRHNTTPRFDPNATTSSAKTANTKGNWIQAKTAQGDSSAA
jgi:hypothetical protein